MEINTENSIATISRALASINTNLETHNIFIQCLQHLADKARQTDAREQTTKEK
jgi:hypothetical protein